MLGFLQELWSLSPEVALVAVVALATAITVLAVEYAKSRGDAAIRRERDIHGPDSWGV